MTRVRKFFKLSSRERTILMRSFVWVVLYRIGLWILPFDSAKRWALGNARPVSEVYDHQMVAEIVRAVTFASRYVPYASCLTQALAAKKLLRHSGQIAELKIGVTKSNGEFEAHAWLEIDGRIVLGRQRMHSRYAVLSSYQTAMDECEENLLQGTRHAR